MEYIFQHKTEEERLALLVAHKDKFLIAVKNITEGNFLIFSDYPKYTTDQELLAQKEKIFGLEIQNSELMMAVAELAAVSDQDKIETQLAIAELAAIITGGIE